MLARSGSTANALLTAKPLDAVAFWATATVRNGVMDGTRDVNTRAMQISPIESDVKHGMGEEESAYLAQREDCALRVNVHRHCYKCDCVYLSIVACTVEWEEVYRCMELLKKLFCIGQQYRYTNANAKRRVKVKKKGEQQRRGNARGRAKSGLAAYTLC